MLSFCADELSDCRLQRRERERERTTKVTSIYTVDICTTQIYVCFLQHYKALYKALNITLDH